MSAGGYASPGAWRHRIAESDLSSSARLVAHTMALFIPKGHRSTFVGTRRLAEASGLARNTVLAALDELRIGGWIVEDPTPRGLSVTRYPTFPEGGAVTEPPSGAMSEPPGRPEGGSVADEGGATTDEGGSVADTGGALTAPELRDNSDLTLRRTPPAAPPRCVCNQKQCGQKIQHTRQYQADPVAFLAEHIGASMEIADAS